MAQSQRFNLLFHPGATYGILLDIAFIPDQAEEVRVVQAVPQDEPPVQTDAPLPHVRVDDATAIAGIPPAIWRRWCAMYAAGGDHRRRLAFEIVSPAYDYYIADIWPLLERHAGPCMHRAQSGCITHLHHVLDDPTQLREVERYIAKYPWFDYGDVPARLAQLKQAQ